MYINTVWGKKKNIDLLSKIEIFVQIFVYLF